MHINQGRIQKPCRLSISYKGVFTYPGAIAFTRIPYSAHSTARVRVKALIPAFATAYGSLRGQAK